MFGKENVSVGLVTVHQGVQLLPNNYYQSKLKKGLLLRGNTIILR